MKYTDEQIKKAVEKCLTKSVFGECEDCAFDREKPCIPTLVKNLFDLINRQEAEIERLNDVVKRIQHHSRNLCLLEKELINRIKSEAIKELMFNLNGDISAYSNAGHDLDVYAWLQNYAEKMVGESK